MERMVVLVVVVLALVAAVVVVLLARTEAPRRDGEGPVRAFVRGLRGWLRPDAEQRAEARAAAAEPVDVTFDQMVRANLERGEGYLRPEEIAESVHEAVASVLPGHPRPSDGPAAVPPRA